MALLAGLTPTAAQDASAADIRAVQDALALEEPAKGAEAAKRLLDVHEQSGEVSEAVRADGHRVLGLAALARREHLAAEDHLRAAVQIDPDRAIAHYQLGQALFTLVDCSANSAAFFHIARAAYEDGPGAIDPERRIQIEAYLAKIYQKYTGSLDGLAELRELALRSTWPPKGYFIQQATPTRKLHHITYCDSPPTERDALRSREPQVAVLLDLKDALQSAAEGATIWGQLEGKLAPVMAGYIVAGSESDRLELSATPGGPVLVVLYLQEPFGFAPHPGHRLTFEGVAESVALDPFTLTLVDGRIVQR